MTLSSNIQKRLEIQGFVCSPAPEFAAIVPWLRLTYGLCAVLVALATYLASIPFLWVLAVLAAIGAILPVHPFDLLYNYGIRYLTGTGPLPKNGMPKRFACGMGAVWIVAVSWLFQAGYMTAGYFLGGAFAGAAGLAALTYFCIPSAMFGIMFGRK